MSQVYTSGNDRHTDVAVFRQIVAWFISWQPVSSAQEQATEANDAITPEPAQEQATEANDAIIGTALWEFLRGFFVILFGDIPAESDGAAAGNHAAVLGHASWNHLCGSGFETNFLYAPFIATTDQTNLIGVPQTPLWQANLPSAAAMLDRCTSILVGHEEDGREPFEPAQDDMFCTEVRQGVRDVVPSNTYRALPTNCGRILGASLARQGFSDPRAQQGFESFARLVGEMVVVAVQSARAGPRSTRSATIFD